MSPEFNIRLIRTYDEYIAVADLQKEVWGEDSIEIVPPSILMVNQKIGGVVAGAFTRDDQLIAFVYGLPGFRDNKEVHWSHMLAVKPAWRGKGLGRQLKFYQREYVIARDIDIMHWTYDPLESVNAMLNLNNLGALPVEYVRDLYGKGERSILHKGIGTDRLILSWYMKPAMRKFHMDQLRVPDDPFSVPAVISDALSFEPAETDAAAVKIEIPANIQQVKNESPDDALAWREATREAFLHYFSLNYGVVTCVNDPESKRYYYIMAQHK